MAELSQLLAAPPMVEWIKATVIEVEGDYVSLSYRGGQIDNAAYLSSYTPVANDIVHALSLSGMGILVLGASNGTGAAVDPLPTEIEALVSADGASTWHRSGELTAWETGVLVSTGPDDLGVWLYDTGLFTAAGVDMLTKFEIEVNMTGGGPAEFFLHNQAGASGDLEVVSSDPFVTSWTPLGVLTWVELPVGWGEDLISGAARGIGVGGGLFSATWSPGGGRLRFTGV